MRLEDPFDGDARLDDISLAPFAPPGFSLWRSDAPQAESATWSDQRDNELGGGDACGPPALLIRQLIII